VLKPLIAIPYGAGTEPRPRAVSIFDLTRMHAETGIASRRLKPTLGFWIRRIRDDAREVATSSGLDI